MPIQRNDYQRVYHKVGGHQTIFEISDENIAGDPSYFGYLNETGGWIIQQRTESTGAYRYVIGQSGYAAAWTARASQTYVLFSAL